LSLLRALFPRSAERGSIEAFLRGRALEAFKQFPRSAERGSIEAAAASGLISPARAVSTLG